MRLVHHDRRLVALHLVVIFGLGRCFLDRFAGDVGLADVLLFFFAAVMGFRNDGPLDMRMDTTRGVPASEWLATVPEQQLEKVIREYGEERFAFQIAKAIAAGRAVQPISSTRQLAGIVAGAVKTREKGKDPATRTFQAIRIFINQELEDLEAGLEAAASAGGWVNVRAMVVGMPARRGRGCRPSTEIPQVISQSLTGWFAVPAQPFNTE